MDKNTFGSAIILAGGKSLRMGFDKQLMEINGQRLIDLRISQLSRFFDEIIISTNQTHYYKNRKDIIAVKDIIAHHGPISGVYTGLSIAKSKYVYVIACDMVDLNLSYIEYMINRIQNENSKGNGLASACITEFGQHLEPFNAFYNVDIAGPIRDAINNNVKSLQKVIKNLGNVIYIKEAVARKFSNDWAMFSNLNTQEEYKKYISLWESLNEDYTSI